MGDTVGAKPVDDGGSVSVGPGGSVPPPATGGGVGPGGRGVGVASVGGSAGGDSGVETPGLIVVNVASGGSCVVPVPAGGSWVVDWAPVDSTASIVVVEPRRNDVVVASDGATVSALVVPSTGGEVVTVLSSSTVVVVPSTGGLVVVSLSATVVVVVPSTGGKVVETSMAVLVSATPVVSGAPVVSSAGAEGQYLLNAS